MTNELLQTETITNKTFSEIQIGDSATLTRVLTKTDITLFAGLTGNLNPVHFTGELEENYKAHHKLHGHGGWVAALISNLIGNEIPGPGAIYKNQSIFFHNHVCLDDTLTVTLTVKEKIEDGHLVIFDVNAKNQNEEKILTGSVTAEAPTKKKTHTKVVLPEIKIRPKHHVFENLISKCQDLEPITTAVCHPCDLTSLQGAVDAAKAHLIKPILIGPKEQIEQIAKENKIDISPYEILSTENYHDSAKLSVSLCRENKVEALMKGSLHTDEMMREVTNKERGLRTSRRISHVYVMSVPTYPKTLFVTDAAINIYPTLEDKIDICQNAIDCALALGVENPKVAILSAVETVYPKITSTIDAAALCKMADRGQITGGLLDGPLAFDNAVSLEAARIKKITSPVAGQADILLVPDLEAGNMVAKQLNYLAEADTAGIVLGARVPIILTSRAESPKARLASCSVAAMVAHARRATKRH